MDRLETMRVFVLVAEQQSFAATARVLGLSPAQVTRAVAAVEARCGATLLQRTTRVVRLTEVGASYLAQCKRLLAEIDEAEAQAGAGQRALSGQVSVTAPVLFGRMHVAKVVLAFLKQHPGVSVRALFSDQVVDLLDQNIDVAIRIASLPDSSLRAIRVGSVRRVVCAAPSYLRAHGTPRRPAELLQHELIAFAGMGEPQAWSFQVEGKSLRIRPSPRLIVNSADLAIQAVSAGHGLTKVLSYQVAREVQEKRLRIVLADFEGPEVPVHVLHSEGRNPSARVRAFVDYAVAELRSTLASGA
ncbi:MAG: Transcriptional regulator, LysR family protein [Myxococcaceae bacterium]|nr:Transcriptional regulator, LysR family protein [Myxococcaceae bacterium]